MFTGIAGANATTWQVRNPRRVVRQGWNPRATRGCRLYMSPTKEIEENFYENFKIEVEKNNAYVQEAKRAFVLHSDTQVTNITSSKRTLFLTNSRRSIRDLRNKVTNLPPCLPRPLGLGPPPLQLPAGPQPPCRHLQSQDRRLVPRRTHMDPAG